MGQWLWNLEQIREFTGFSKWWVNQRHTPLPSHLSPLKNKNFIFIYRSICLDLCWYVYNTFYCKNIEIPYVSSKGFYMENFKKNILHFLHSPLKQNCRGKLWFIENLWYPLTFRFSMFTIVHMYIPEGALSSPWQWTNG